jgi:hypothetical protein
MNKILKAINFNKLIKKILGAKCFLIKRIKRYIFLSKSMTIFYMIQFYFLKENKD